MRNAATSIGQNRGRCEEKESLHPAWRKLIQLCESMGYGEIEKLKIHDGLPALAEVTRQKVKLD